MVRADGISRLPISYFVWIFVGYIVGHICIGLLQKKYAEELIKNPSDADVQKTNKILTILMTWFPAIYLVIVMIGFYI